MGRDIGTGYMGHGLGYFFLHYSHPPGLHKTGIRGIQDTRQIADGKTNDIEITTKKVGTNS